MIYLAFLREVQFLYFLSERAEKRGELKLRKLKPSAIPSTFPNLPSYLSKKFTGERSSTTSVESRHLHQQQQHEEDVQLYFDEEKVTNLNDIFEKFSSRYPLPEGVILQKVQNSLVIFALDLLSHGMLEVKFNISIFENLKFEIFCRGVKLDAVLVAHIAKQKITSFGELFNIISFAKALAKNQ